MTAIDLKTSHWGTRSDAGGVVASTDGPGVVTSVLTDDFGGPRGEDDVEDVSAADERPGDVVGLEDLPEGWDRESVLEYREESAASGRSASRGPSDEFPEDRTERLCAAMRDELLRTRRWRNRS